MSKTEERIEKLEKLIRERRNAKLNVDELEKKMLDILKIKKDGSSWIQIDTHSVRGYARALIPKESMKTILQNVIDLKTKSFNDITFQIEELLIDES